MFSLAVFFAVICLSSTQSTTCDNVQTIFNGPVNGSFSYISITGNFQVGNNIVPVLNTFNSSFIVQYYSNDTASIQTSLSVNSPYLNISLSVSISPTSEPTSAPKTALSLFITFISLITFGLLFSNNKKFSTAIVIILALFILVPFAAAFVEQQFTVNCSTGTLVIYYPFSAIGSNVVFLNFNALTFTSAPTPFPTSAPTPSPTSAPTVPTTGQPTDQPTPSPTSVPTTGQPTDQPTPSPTSAPTLSPTAAPTLSPTAAPTLLPTAAPTLPPV